MKALYRAFLGVLLWGCLLTFLQACKPSIPSEYLSKGKMEDILYDFHIAEEMANIDPASDEHADMITYRAAVLKKHGVTEAEFDSSMVYYTRHTKLLHDIYVKLGDRLTAEAQSLGADVSNMNQYGAISSGDTANVWNGAQSYVFSPYEPFNYSSFAIPVDSGFHKGDKLIMDFDAQFIFQDGMRDGVAVLAITLGNDSVVSTNVRVCSSQHYTLQVEDRDSLGIKSVKGYFLLNSGDFSSSSGSFTTLKLMFLQNIKLVRMHAAKAPAANPSSSSQTGDSAARISPSPGTPAQLPPPNGPRPSLSAPSTAPLPPGKIQTIDVKADDKSLKR